MTKSKATALLWFVGGALFVAVWWMSDQRRVLSLIAGVLFFVVGIVTLWRGRQSPAPPAA
jgi:intracellular septation protein A